MGPPRWSACCVLSVLWEHGQGCPHLACCASPTWAPAAASAVGTLDPGKGMPGDVEPAQPGDVEISEGGWDAAVCPGTVRPLRGVALEDLFDHDRQAPPHFFELAVRRLVELNELAERTGVRKPGQWPRGLFLVEGDGEKVGTLLMALFYY